MSRITRVVQRRVGSNALTVPPISAPGTSAEYYDDVLKRKMLSVDGGAYAPMVTGTGGGIVVQIADFNLSADVSTTTLAPAWSTLMSVAMVTVRPASFLQIAYYDTVLFIGGAGNRACARRVLVNGVPLPISRAVTTNAIVSQIQSATFLRRVAVVAGLQTVVVEWQRFGGGLFDTMNCRPATLPDLEGAYIQLQEQAS